MLGDIHIAEPGALIGFAGPRVIEQTIREKLPDGFQRSEYLLDHGMIDMVVHRHDLRDTLSRLCSLLVTERKHRAGMNNVKQKAAAASGASPEIRVPATAEQLAAASNKSKPGSEDIAEEVVPPAPANSILMNTRDFVDARIKL